MVPESALFVEFLVLLAILLSAARLVSVYLELVSYLRMYALNACSGMLRCCHISVSMQISRRLLTLGDDNANF